MSTEHHDFLNCPAVASGKDPPVHKNLSKNLRVYCVKKGGSCQWNWSEFVYEEKVK